MGKVDLIAADIPITPERAQVVGFSRPDVVTGQQFLVFTASPDKLDDYGHGLLPAVQQPGLAGIALATGIITSATGMILPCSLFIFALRRVPARIVLSSARL
ncbi:transporter substrate-binding domain-containing protein [Cedecea colo]|uniref:transporter substrate-binding domain-containing protein n=1 Tax=Cedecea colo TaxID=2552946 RepID=UPI003B838B47